MTELFQAIAALCAMYSPNTSTKALLDSLEFKQIQCQKYYAQCVLDQRERTYPNHQKLLVCMVSRSGQ